MTRFHINPQTGTPGPCGAAIRCPFGGEAQHYGSESEARQAYEAQMGNGGLTGMSRTSEIEAMDNLLHDLESFVDDLEGSVPYPEHYRDSVATFIEAVTEDENSLAGVARVAEDYALSESMADAMIGEHVKAELGRIEARRAELPAAPAPEAPPLRSSSVEPAPGGIKVRDEIEEQINRWPSTYSARTDAVLRNATALMYEAAEDPSLSKEDFDAKAKESFAKLSKNKAYFEDGITDTEPRGYWADHMDNIREERGWVYE